MATLGPTDYAIEEQEKENIMQSEDDTETKRTKLNAIRSFVESDKTLSSFQVISAMLNTMIGSGCLLLPSLFISCGIFSSIAVILVICFSSGSTCVLFCVHAREDDDDILPLIKKLVGDIPYKIYKIFNMLLLLAVGFVLYLFSVNMCFGGGSYLLGLMNVPIADANEITFTKFSMPIAAIAIGLIGFGLLFIKDIKTIIEIGKYGSFGLHGFTIFLVGYAIYAMTLPEFSLNNLEMFKLDFLPICGLMATAFMIHPTVVPIVKKHKNPELIERDVYITYAIAAIMYTGYGILGAIGIATITPRKEVYTDYFPDVKGFVVQVLFFSTLITAFPILAFCGRVAFFDIFTQEKIKGSSKLIFNVVYVAIITSCAAFGIPILPVVGFAGAVFGFYIAYVSPILVHFACIQNMEKHEEGNPSSSLLSTCGHEKPTVSKPVLIIYYSIVTLIGLLLLVQEIYGTVAKFFN